MRDLGKKLDESTIEIAAFGMVSRGKSSVLTRSWDRMSSRSARPTERRSASCPALASRCAGRPGLEGARLVVVDTPGIDEVGGEVREALARDVARHTI